MIQPEPTGLDTVFPKSGKEIRQYVDILLTDGMARGVIGPGESKRIWSRHILNSAALGNLLSPNASVVDVGSGAGLPGIPLVLARRDVSMTLLEPLLRRVRFLGETVAELGIADEVALVRGRAEEYDEKFDYVVSRAVAPLSKLVRWCAPLMNPGGEILALKGDRANQELADSTEQLDSLDLAAEVVPVSALQERTNVVRVRHHS